MRAQKLKTCRFILVFVCLFCFVFLLFLFVCCNVCLYYDSRMCNFWFQGSLLSALIFFSFSFVYVFVFFLFCLFDWGSNVRFPCYGCLSKKQYWQNGIEFCYRNNFDHFLVCLYVGVLGVICLLRCCLFNCWGVCLFVCFFLCFFTDYHSTFGVKLWVRGSRKNWKECTHATL